MGEVRSRVLLEVEFPAPRPVLSGPSQALTALARRSARDRTRRPVTTQTHDANGLLRYTLAFMNDRIPDILLTGRDADRIWKASRSLPKRPGSARSSTPMDVSLDIYRTHSSIEVERDTVRCGNHSFNTAPLKRLAKRPRRIFGYTGAPTPTDENQDPDATWVPVETYEGGYHQLVSWNDTAPALEIGGIQMHRTKGTDPFHSAAAMTEACVQAGDRVLDCCGGLGYSAIRAAQLGARSVLSCELSAGTLYLRARNPWSRPDDDAPIRWVHADVFATIAPMPASSFDSIVHDPPRYSLATALYSDAFYLKLFDVLAPGGRLFHYTGEPRSRSHGDDLMKSVAARLERIGFQARVAPELLGVVAERPAAVRAGRR